MKIGFSYSRCVRDIVDGAVDPKDVLVIIARTDFDPRNDEQWAAIWQGYRSGGLYSRAEWCSAKDSDEARYREVSVMLLEAGQLHQPRQFGAHPPQSSHTWVDTGPIGIERRPQAVQDAWKQYQVLASLAQDPARFHDDF